MRVLVVSNIPFPYIVDFFNELGKHCDLTVLFLRKSARDRDKSWLSDNVKNFNAIYLKGIEFGSENVLCFSVLKWLKPGDFDVICFDCYSRATSILGIQYMKLINKPFVISADGGFIKNDSFFGKQIKKNLIGSAAFWMSTGNNTDKYLINYGAKKDKIFSFPFTSLVENDVLKEIVSSEEKNKIKSNLGIFSEKVILSVGRFIPLKRFDVLIKAAKKLPEKFGVYIVGGEPTDEYLEIIREQDIKNVHFVGFKTKLELKEFYKAADLFVFPTSSDVWGLVVNEAMACGLPVITTDMCIAGLELINNNENGFIVPVGDVNLLADKINLILKDEALLEEMSQNSLKKIKEYTIENMAIKQAEIFKNINSHFKASKVEN